MEVNKQQKERLTDENSRSQITQTFVDDDKEVCF